LDRCDFSSIMTCLKNHISESNQMNQPEFLYEVFEDFMDSPESKDFSFDNGLVCRWMTGQAKISPKICTYYARPSKQEKLAETLQHNLIPLMTDCNKALQDVYLLFMQDATISEAKKEKLAALYKPIDSRLLFLAKLISFGMERQFIKRDTRNQKLLAGGSLSPIVLDYIMDSEVPRPCRHCIKDGVEKGFTASEFKDAQKDGWEKQYRYKVGKKKVYLTPSVAQEKGYERIDKHPKSSRYGRQNPISEQWNSDEQLHIWRANWADAVNKLLAHNQINATIDHRSFADQGITEQPTIHEGYIAQNMEKKGMKSDRCEINHQIRADNKMLRELKAQVAKLAEAVEKSIPIIAETLETIRNHMIFTQYHLLHNEMQKEVIHDWMQHFNPILNKYDTVKKKLKAKVAERKELNVKKEKASILNPLQHIKLNQQLTTVTEEIEELKSRKEQLIFQAQCSTDKDMTNLSKKYDQMNKNLDILDFQDSALKEQLKKDAFAFREEKFIPDPEQYTELLDTRIQIRPDFRDKLIEQLKSTFGKYYDYHRRDIAANEVDYLNVEDPDVFSHRAWELEYQRKQEVRRNQPVRTKKRSHDMEL
jgi:hypothetical protein